MNPCLAFGSEYQQEFTYKSQKRTLLAQPIDARLLSEQIKNKTLHPQQDEKSFEDKERLIHSLVLGRLRTETQVKYPDPQVLIMRSKDLDDEELTNKLLEYHKNIYLSTEKKIPQPRRPTNQRTMGYSTPDDLCTGISVYQDIHSRTGLHIFMKNAALIAALNRKRKILKWMQAKNKAGKCKFT